MVSPIQVPPFGVAQEKNLHGKGMSTTGKTLEMGSLEGQAAAVTWPSGTIFAAFSNGTIFALSCKSGPCVSKAGPACKNDSWKVAPGGGASS